MESRLVLAPSLIEAFALLKASGGIVWKQRSSPYRSGPHWLKAKNPESPAVRHEGFEDWGRKARG